MLIFDPQQLDRQRQQALAFPGDHFYLIEEVWRRLADRVGDIKRRFTRPLVLGARAATVIEPLLIPKKIDAFPRMAEMANEIVGPPDTQGYDIILSCFDLHTINDLPGLLIQLRQLLAPDGVMIAAFPGGQTLYELRAALSQAEMEIRGGVSPRIFPFVDKMTMAGLMQRAGFSLPVVDSDTIRVDYSSMRRLVDDLRHMGEGNAIAARDKRVPPRALFRRADQIYRERFMEMSGAIPATFEIIYAIGWAPGAHQPQPLPRGSGQIPLGDVLG